MSKFANSKFFLCHVVGIFSSWGSTFSLARPCFGACRDTCIGCMICKNFYIIFAFCPCIFFCIWLAAEQRGKMRKMQTCEPKQANLWVKMPSKRENPISRFCAGNGWKDTRKRHFGCRNAQKGRRKGVFDASWKFSPYHWNSAHYAKLHPFLKKKNLHSVALANYFTKLYVSDYQIIMM